MDPSPLHDRFWKRVDKNGPIHQAIGSRCWIWTGAKSRGYGQISSNGKIVQAHRLSYEIRFGPHGLQVLHRCDVRNCVNPEHLFLGTHADNMADMARKGRDAIGKIQRERRARGERHGVAKLNSEAVKQARAMYAEHTPKARIAKMLGVSDTTITRLLRGDTWGHVK